MNDGSSNDESSERARHTRLVHDAFARGQAALASDDRAEALRWLDRAHRLAPADGTIALVLASALIGGENEKAAALFAKVLTSHHVRDAWLGLATAHFLTGNLGAAAEALASLLSLHAWRPDTENLANQVARAVGSPGWCGLTGDGVLTIHPLGSGRISRMVDGGRMSGDALPPGWPRMGLATVMAGTRHLIGSPISLRTIGRVEGHVEAWAGGVRGWAWYPGDPDTDPKLSVGGGRSRIEIVATEPGVGIPGLAPLARPRSFAIPSAGLPAGAKTVRLRGWDGRNLAGSPVMIAAFRHPASTPRHPASTPRHPPARPEDQSRHRDGPDPRVKPEDDGERGTNDGERGTNDGKWAANGEEWGKYAGEWGATAAPIRRKRDLAQWRGNAAGAVILITHDDGGGVERRIQTSIASHEAKGRWPIILRPVKQPDGTRGVTVDGRSAPTLRFDMPREQPALLRLLRDTKPIQAELHHLLNHDPAVLDTIRALGIPYDVHTHDFAWFCPRIALVGRGDRYCGEPSPAACQKCVTKLGSYLHEHISVAALLDRSRQILSGANRVIAPSRDTASRMERHFHDLSLTVVPHEDDGILEEPPPIRPVTGTVRVCVAGAIGLHKGFHVLLACARDARKRGLDLMFTVAGTTIDDQSLIDTGRVFVTGPYQPDEAVALIRAQGATLALLPSIWPETWCLGLTELWRAGLRVAAFDLGAPAERISRTGRGFLLPLGLPPPAINDALLNAARGRSLLPIRSTSAYKPSH